MKPLFVPLKKQYFEQFLSGSKTTEYRLAGKRWNPAVAKVGRQVTLSCGYSGDRISAVITKTEIVKNSAITSIYPPDSDLIAVHLNIQKST